MTHSICVAVAVALVAWSFSSCSKQEDTGTPLQSKPPSAGAKVQADEPEQPPKPLEEVLVGVWETVDPEQLSGAEKVTIDFRESGEFTLISHQSPPSSVSGTYKVQGNDLTMVQEAGAISTKYDGKILTVTDDSADQSVDFKRID